MIRHLMTPLGRGTKPLARYPLRQHLFAFDAVFLRMLSCEAIRLALQQEQDHEPIV